VGTGTSGAGVPPASDVVAHFDRLSATGAWYRLYEDLEPGTYQFHVRRQRVLELLPDRLGRVADVGCGPGILADAVTARHGSWLGMDASAEMVREARRRFGHLPGTSVQQASIEHLPFRDATFDQVICIAVLEYLKTADRALAELARVTRPGGVAVITVPRRRHIDNVTIAATTPLRWLARALGFESRADTLPRLLMQPEDLDAGARRAGFEPDGGRHYYFTVVPYPLTRLVPRPVMRLNLRFERWAGVRTGWRAFFAHGYIGRYVRRG
jgi:ubiquinone/menaquinone biosynthesis C-methylase UbiE